MQAALQPILEGFRWLGMDWDEGPEVGGPYEPYFQSQRTERYREAAEQLLASGHAYRDFAKPEELQEQRTAAEKAGETFVYDRRWMAEDDAAAAKFIAEGRQGVVRLKMPREGQCVIQDQIRGEVRVEWASEQDHVVQRADGSCLYHLASVVDDYDFKITHVVRAAEHLPNTPRQVFIAQALGFELPQYAHLPYVAEPGGTAKLSKRKLEKYKKNKDFASLLEHGQRIADRCGMETDGDTFNPVIVDFYREVGFLPEAILNYLLLLGWALDGSREEFTREEMIELFTLSRVNKAPASFDPQKLVAFQADHMARHPLAAKISLVEPYLKQAGLVSEPLSESDQAKIEAVVKGAGDRLKVAGDVLDFDYCFVAADALQYDEKAWEKRISKDPQAVELLGKFAERLGQLATFDAESLEQALKAYCDEAGIKIGQIIHALRVATTGQPVGFGMFETLETL